MAIEQSSQEHTPVSLTLGEFALALSKLPVTQAATVLMRAEPNAIYQISILKHMPDEFRSKVANHIFGDKIAGDIGARSTNNHPKTDYGEPRMGMGWDIDCK